MQMQMQMQYGRFLPKCMKTLDKKLMTCKRQRLHGRARTGAESERAVLAESFGGVRGNLGGVRAVIYARQGVAWSNLHMQENHNTLFLTTEHFTGYVYSKLLNSWLPFCQKSSRLGCLVQVSSWLAP